MTPSRRRLWFEQQMPTFNYPGSLTDERRLKAGTDLCRELEELRSAWATGMAIGINANVAVGVEACVEQLDRILARTPGE
ncbi:MAG: hypothetical protein Q7O66_02045 [Dehalococcoidia bacterium]|nr:hypothetical protein [Dehalococcoidia bacterium]